MDYILFSRHATLLLYSTLFIYDIWTIWCYIRHFLHMDCMVCMDCMIYINYVFYILHLNTRKQNITCKILF